MLNHEIVHSLLTEMQKNADLLAEFGAIPKEKFVGDAHRYLLAERCFQLAIQCVLDICYYIASKNGWEKPEDGAAAILLMGQKGVLPSEFARKIVGMANFRNILVHAYLNINRDIVYSHLGEVGDFSEFQRHILTFLDSSKASTQ